MEANYDNVLKGRFHTSAHVCITYSPVHAFWHRPSFSFFVNQSLARYLVSHANSRKIISNRIHRTRELESICDLFSPRKAPGYDNISMRVIKHSFHLISVPLANKNLSLVKGIFPDRLKLGKIIPIYKTEDPSLFVNYRPISLLPNFSKFFEKVMYNRLVEFVEMNEVFYLRQFGFRKNHSTSHALIHLLNKISSAIDQLNMKPL